MCFVLMKSLKLLNILNAIFCSIYLSIIYLLTYLFIWNQGFAAYLLIYLFGIAALASVELAR